MSLVKPTRHLAAAPWQCLRCGSVLLASPQRRDGSEFHGGVRRSDFRTIYNSVAPRADVSPSHLSDEDIKQLRNCTKSVELPSHELRQSQRYAVAVPLNVVTLNEKFCVTSPPQIAYSIDISTGGMSLLYPKATEAALYAVEFADGFLNIPPVILRPIRCSRLGNGFAIAGDFVCRVDY